MSLTFTEIKNENSVTFFPFERSNSPAKIFNERRPDVYRERVKKGDTASFQFLVEKYQDLVYSVALKVVKNSNDAQDAAQEGFIKAYQQLYKFEGKSKFSTWLYTIVYRAAIDRLNKRSFLSISDDYEETDDSTPATMLADQEQSLIIKRAVDMLPASESLIITLFYMNECSVKEIAMITGFTETNIKVKMFRAKKTLQNQLRFLL